MREAVARPLRPALLAGMATLWMAGSGNAALWRELHTLGLLQARSGWLLAASLAIVLAASLFALLSALAWRPLLKPAIALLLVTTAAGSHFMETYGVVIDGAMAINASQTDWSELQPLLTPRLAFALAVGGLLPAWIAWRLPVAYSPWPRQAMRNAGAVALALLLAVAVIATAFHVLAPAMRNHRHVRYLLNPLNSVYALAVTAVGRRRATRPPAALGVDARLAADGRPPLLVVVLGETARSGNFALNGYPRDTTPELAAEGVASFRNAWACGTSTAASVPCMFSHLGREAYLARAGESENLLDVLQHAGLAVLWLDNQGGCKGVCARVPSVERAQLQAEGRCGGGECPDGVLLRGLDERIAALPAARRARGVVVVLHQMGSHGPAYAERSPAAFKRFLPECASSHLPDCSAEALRNAYDNSIAYTDHVLAGTIRWLRRQEGHAAGLLYVSDHGESLGENNLYLHGLPYAVAPDVQKHVPWIAWLSAGLEQRSGVSLACLRAHADAPLSHDHLFHTVLGLLQVRTAAYRMERDGYAACRQRSPADAQRDGARPAAQAAHAA